MEKLLFYYWSFNTTIKVLYVAYAAFFAISVLKLPVSKWEKLGWIAFIILLPLFGAFIFYTLRNSKFLLRHSRRKFNPIFRKSN
jgi:hypothetical protein